MNEARNVDRASIWRRPLIVMMLILLLAVLITTGPTAIEWIRYEQQWVRVNGVIGSVRVERFGGKPAGPIQFWWESNGSLFCQGESGQGKSQLTCPDTSTSFMIEGGVSLENVRGLADSLVLQESRVAESLGRVVHPTGEIPQGTPPAPWIAEGLEPEVWWASRGE